jgi:hypothetical protein
MINLGPILDLWNKITKKEEPIAREVDLPKKRGRPKKVKA